MKHQKSIFTVCVACAVLLGILRAVAMPLIAQHQTTSFWNVALLVLTVAVLTFCAFAPLKSRDPLHTFSGNSASFLSGCSLFTAFSLFTSIGYGFSNWIGSHTLPYPNNPTLPNGTLLFLLLSVFGLVSGVFFLSLGIHRPFSALTPGNGKIYALLALAPIVWSWLRIGQYEMASVSSANVFLSLYDLLVLLSESVFMLCLARFIAKPSEAYPRLTIGAALITGVLTIVACLARTLLLLSGKTEAAHLCDLVSAPDLGIGLSALSLVCGQWFAPIPKEPESTAIQCITDEDGETHFLLSDHPELFMSGEMNLPQESSFTDQEQPRTPLEWNDILSDFLSNETRNKE